MKSVVFIHRSVGQQLIDNGGLRQLLASQGKLSLTDYNQNNDILTEANGRQRKMGFIFPGGNTRPEDLATIFSEPGDSKYDSIKAEMLKYDVVMVKSCYPNSNIGSDDELERIKQYYLYLIDFFAGQRKELVILTSPPLVPWRTDSDKAARARTLASWLVSLSNNSGVRVFDLFGLLATEEGIKHSNRLRVDYQRWWPFDSHPSAKAAKEIVPQLVDFLGRS